MKQLERSKRYLKRIRLGYDGVHNSSLVFQDFEDDLSSFFMHCYHVRDWLIHSEHLSITAKQVDEFINSNDFLKICADLCNGSKHCKLTRSTRTGYQPNLINKESFGLYGASLISNESFSLESARCSVQVGDRSYDALLLAEACIDAWVLFLNQQNT
ncbi:hypothetical protein ACYVLC_003401 [Vibrio cholerae]|uniref:hypothetical protein n=1 Tax=Vibrio TaxID=662 RepID=UPI000B53B30A|nr:MULTISPECIES: hypothetical protein [Vibrio]EJL6684747.1 hypothetical protein [Vibrio cholerae]ASG09142.1 hypothetical protein CEQ50_16545 [Vibrio anguillarum]NAW89433.1 hypothetical protein [Vibrio sp. V24_P1S3T111]OXX31261.1 hypothetical protein B9J81_14350 [Vibrio sp. V04_P4A5T148]OXX35681.1 hypothetical protein B9J95_01730 [Vibrio sp. V14_P6S14T42]